MIAATMGQELRYALRGLIKSPSFTAVAVFSLALGIGANSATFSVLHAVLLNPLPYQEPARLVALHEFADSHPSTLQKVSLANYVDVKARARSFEAMGYYVESYASKSNVTGAGEADHLRSPAVSDGFFSVLGVSPVMGRELQEDSPERVGLVVSHGFWTRRLGGAGDVIGRQVLLDEEPVTIVAVLPADFGLQGDIEMWRQLTPAFIAPFIHQRTDGNRSPIARLRSGVTIAEAQAEMDVIARQLAVEYPRENGGRGIRVVPLTDHLAGTAATPIRILYGAVCLVLLIACANVSGLLLARLRARQREIGLRLALGASRARLARQLLTESLLLALPGAGAGLLLASWLVDLIVRLAPADLSRIEDVAINVPVALFTVVVSVACAMLFGLAPIIQAGRVQSATALGQQRTTTSAPDRMRVALIVAEMALALVLLVGAGLLVRTYIRLTNVDLGFTADRVVTMDVTTQGPRYEGNNWTRVVAFHDQALSQLAAVPGVRSVAVTSLLPLHEREGRFTIGVARNAAEPERTAEYRFVSAGYFDTLQVPLLRGRDFVSTDRVGAERVAILGASTAKALFGEADPIGQEILIRRRTPRLVVGVIPDIHLYGPRTAPPLQIYAPYPQANDIYWTGLRFVLRTDADPAVVTEAARQRLLAVEPSLPPFNVQSLSSLIAGSLAPTRMYGALLVAFALLALVLACVGLYGLIAFLVTQRTREFGIRLALGANAADVRSLVVRETARLVTLALLAGGALAVAGGRLLETLLFGVSSTDWVTFGAVSILLVAVAFLASYAPARRAMRVDPVMALRTE